MRRRAKRIWAAYRQFSAIRGLLELLGLWGWVGLAMVTIVSTVTTLLAHVPKLVMAAIWAGSIIIAAFIIGSAPVLRKAWIESSSSAGSLSLLVTTMVNEKPQREDLQGVYLITAAFRSNYTQPVGVKLLQWEPRHPGKTSLISLRGMLTDVPSFEDYFQHYEPRGASALIVHPNQAFRVFVEVRCAPSEMDDHGTIILLVEGEMVPFRLYRPELEKAL